MKQSTKATHCACTPIPKWLKFVTCLFLTWGLTAPVKASDVPPVGAGLKQVLTSLPIAGIKDELQSMVGTLKKTGCGPGFKGCYMTQSGPLQLYFFTNGEIEQTLLLVVDKKVAMPHLLGEKVQKVMGETSLNAPILSISTTDFELDNIRMPPALQKIVRDKYFNINTLSFSSGVQMAARVNLGGRIKMQMESLGVDASNMMMRAAMVMPIPADLASAAGGGAAAVAQAKSLREAGADAVKPESFIEFQFPPNANLQLIMPKVQLADAVFFLNNELVFGYKGNARFEGAEDKNIILNFQTPLGPEGAMDLADFSFRMATPASLTMEDQVRIMVAMASPDPRLAKYGGGFIRNIQSFKAPLLAMTKPLSMFQLNNPTPPPQYRFGDSSKPFPTDNKYFNVVLLGPLAEGGPLLKVAGDVTIFGQKMGWLYASAGKAGLIGDAGEQVTLKLGPLGKVPFKLQATTAINENTQNITLAGNVAGQKISIGMDANSMTVAVNATCVNPFEIKTKVEIKPSTNLADVFEGQGGVNVDPGKISGCIGKELEAAYNKIAGEYKHLSGYTASAAQAELNKISNAANQAYEQTKKEAQRAAQASIDAATKLWSGGTNAVVSAVGGSVAKAPDTSHIHYDRSVFDWDYYYDKHPELVAKKVDLVAHWGQTGYPAKWRGSLEFDMAFYAKHPDVVKMWGSNPDAKAVVLDWVTFGIERGRQGSADFDVTSYLARYPDLQRAFGANNYEAAFIHWLDHGKAEGRDGSPGAFSQTPPAGSVRVGGGGGSAWSDDVVCKGQHVTGWRVYSGKKVDLLQFKYPGGWGEAHGANRAFREEVLLAPNEYVVRVSYRGSDEVEGIIFYTNTGRTHGNYGSSKMNGEYKVTPGQKLGCMSGRSGDRTDQLIFRSTDYATNPSQVSVAVPKKPKIKVPKTPK